MQHYSKNNVAHAQHSYRLVRNYIDAWWRKPATIDILVATPMTALRYLIRYLSCRI